MQGFEPKFIEKLKNKNDIVDVVSRYVRLEQRGGNYWGVCPFHHEKTASFSVNPSGQFFYCFGCHKSGDVISFVSEIESLDFGDAVKFLAERAGLDIPTLKIDDEKIREQKKKKERLLQLLKDAALFYAHNLRTSQAEKHTEYIFKRKLNSDTVTAFGLGASLNFNDLPKHLLSKGYTYQEMTESGVVDSKDGRYYDALGGRLIVPIINQFNQVVAFGGRLLEKADFAKYKNTRETVVFSKSNNLYNLNNLKKIKNERGIDSIIIVEGYMDTISLVQAGFHNVVASMGTSLTKDQARILKRYSDKVYISYDGDFAGQKASIRGLEILKEEGLDVKVVSLPDGMDPDDVVKNLGKEGYENCLKSAMPLIDFKLDILRKTFDLTTVDGKRKYVSNAINVIRESPSPAEQEDLLKTVRSLTGTTIEALKRELYSSKKTEPKVENKQVFEINDYSDNKIAVAGRFILYSYLFNKPYAEETEIKEIDFVLPEHKKIRDFIIKRKNNGDKVVFSDLYEETDGTDNVEISKIAGLETSDNRQYDQSLYFNDCLKALKMESINTKLDALTKQFSAEQDTETRRKIATEMRALYSQKNKLI